MKVLLLSLTVFFGLNSPLSAQSLQEVEELYRAGDYQAAFEASLELAKKRNTRAQLYTGAMYELGRGTPVDPPQAERWYLSAALAGDATAQLRLGSLYERGAGIRKDASQAFVWYSQGAQKGLPEAQYRLAQFWEQGLGIKNKDYVQALAWYEKAGKQGHVPSLKKAAVIYQQGLAEERSLEIAFKWYLAAAKLGDAESQRRVGIMLSKGRGGVEKNAEQSNYWLRKAAEQGDALAQTNLGVAYLTGSGVEQNDVEAYAWLWTAAEQDYAVARALGLRLKKRMNAQELQRARVRMGEIRGGESIYEGFGGFKVAFPSYYGTKSKTDKEKMAEQVLFYPRGTAPSKLKEEFYAQESIIRLEALPRMNGSGSEASLGELKDSMVRNLGKEGRRFTLNEAHWPMPGFELEEEFSPEGVKLVKVVLQGSRYFYVFTAAKEKSDLVASLIRTLREPQKELLSFQ